VNVTPIAQCPPAGTEAPQGLVDAATTAFHQSLSLAGPFLAVDKPELSALYYDADASNGMGDAEAQLAAVSHHGPQSEEHWKRAEDWYRKSLSAWERVPADRQGRYTRSLAEQDPKVVAGKLRRCEVALTAGSRGPGRIPTGKVQH
jgi:hypothetical protein